MAQKKKQEQNPFRIDPINEVQKQYLDLLRSKNSIIICHGPAGTGKTLLACMAALEGVKYGAFEKLVITRPVMESGEKLGFLPGTIEEKILPYITPIIDACNFSGNEWGKIKHMVDVAPLAYMRGRAQPLSSIIKTPYGDKQMKDIEIGDEVFGSNGKPCNVTGVFPQGIKKVYKVSFSDGVSTMASEDHLWLTQSRSEYRHNKGFSVKTTKEIIESKIKLTHQHNHEVPVLSGPVEYNINSELPIDPYVLGAMIGDGSFSTDNITFCKRDKNILNEISSRLPDGVQLVDIDDLNHRIIKTKSSSRNIFKKLLKDIGLFGLKSYDKFIPINYMLSSVDNRILLLNGLMDTDGGVISDRGRARLQYYTTSEKLSKDVSELVRSLGGTSSITKKTSCIGKSSSYNNITSCRPSYTLEIKLPDGINPFITDIKLSKTKTRKARLYRFITGIDYVGDLECQCISVSAQDSLYLTDNFIVTHNTFRRSFVIADEMQNATHEQVLMLLTRIGNGSKMVITGDLEQADLPAFKQGALAKAIDKLVGIDGIKSFEFPEHSSVRHPIINQILKAWNE